MDDAKYYKITTFIFSQIFIVGALVLSYIGEMSYAMTAVSVGVILYAMCGIMEHLKK